VTKILRLRLVRGVIKSRDNSVNKATGQLTKGPREGHGNFSFSTTSRQALGPAQTPVVRTYVTTHGPEGVIAMFEWRWFGIFAYTPYILTTWPVGSLLHTHSCTLKTEAVRIFSVNFCQTTRLHTQGSSALLSVVSSVQSWTPSRKRLSFQWRSGSILVYVCWPRVIRIRRLQLLCATNCVARKT
jgi:hypothetical protein